MKILYIDPDDGTSGIRAGWLKTPEREVSIASGIDVPFKDYDLVIVFLGERGSSFDMRPILANANIAGKKENLGKDFLFAGSNESDMVFAQTHRASYCHAFQLSQDIAREAILEKVTGASVQR